MMEDMNNSSQRTIMGNANLQEELDVEHQLVLSSEFQIIVPADAFMGNPQIREVICLEGVCQIGERAFKRCSSLQKLSLPSTLEMIGKNAFCLCTSLVSVSLQEVSDDGPGGGGGGAGGAGSGLKQIGFGAFFGCRLLSSVEIPSSVETIEACAFEGCVSLAELVLRDGLLTIGERAMEGCQRLRQVRVPATVETIQTRAFARCESLVELTLQEGLTTIAGRALEGCTSLERIKIPSTVAILRYSVFGQCSSLMDVTLQDGVTTIGSHVFKTCTSLRRIRIPSTVETIGHSCFARCSSLKDVQLSCRLKFLGDCAFACCRALCAIFLPRSLAGIGESVFDGCSNLVNVEFEVGMDHANIGEFAFCDCSSLAIISIPKGMADLGCLEESNGGYFDGCEHLRKVHGSNYGIAKASAERFELLPVHEKCYHASVTTANDLQESIDVCRFREKYSTGEHPSMVDDFGMTPFHLLLSSATRRQDLLKVLLDNYPSYMLGRKDRFGKRATDYLLGLDWTEDTRSLIKVAFKAWTMDRLEVWDHKAWREESSRRLDIVLNEQNQGRRAKLLSDISAAMERYERFEAASLLELWLWKMMMQLHHCKESDVSHRSGYRIQCGASFIVPVLLGWLDNVAEEEFG